MDDHNLMNEYRSAWEELTAPGAQFELTTVDVLNRPARVFRNAPANLREVWARSERFGDRTYLVYEDERYSFAEIGAQTRSIARVLYDLHGVSHGDRVAIAMRNYPEWVASYWAIVSLGATAVGVNAWWTGPELEFGLVDSRPKVLIADGERLARVGPHLEAIRAVAPLPVIAVRTDGDLPRDASRWGDLVESAAAPAALPDAGIEPDDDVCIFYTSGTTGHPRGVRLTHRGAVTNLLNLSFTGAVTSVAMARATGSPGTEAGRTAPVPLVTLAATPLFHVTACNCVLHPTTLNGGTMVLMHKWVPGRALDLIERERVAVFAGVPTMSRDLISHADWERRDTSSLIGMGGGGAAMQPDMVRKIDAALPAGMPSTGYGLTETSGIVTSNHGPTCRIKPTSCGAVVPTLDAKLVDEAGDTLAASPDAVGRLLVRGAVVMAGYLNSPDDTQRAIDDEGWLDTGDVVRVDEDGFVHIVDRAKDVVVRGGENVSCLEVEAAIYEHPDIAEVAVFGVPDDRLGEVVGAVVVPRAGATVEPADVQRHLVDRLAAFKVPTYVWISAAALPRNANGKFLKRALRDQYALTSSTRDRRSR